MAVSRWSPSYLRVPLVTFVPSRPAYGSFVFRMRFCILHLSFSVFSQRGARRLVQAIRRGELQSASRRQALPRMHHLSLKLPYRLRAHLQRPRGTPPSFILYRKSAIGNPDEGYGAPEHARYRVHLLEQEWLSTRISAVKQFLGSPDPRRTSSAHCDRGAGR